MPFWAAWRASAQAEACAGTGPGASGRSFRFGPVEPAAVPGRKRPLYAPGPAVRLGGRKRPEKRGVGMGVQMVADPDQALGLAVARMIREGLDLVRPVHGRAPRAQRFHEQPDGAGDVPPVCVVVGGAPGPPVAAAAG